MIVFRHADRRFPFLWETAGQPPARWHGEREGPAHYFADTPDGAWAEFLRHEAITEPEDLATVTRALWAIEVPDVPDVTPKLPVETMTGGLQTYRACQTESRRLRDRGHRGFVAPSAALRRGGARGWRVESGFQPGPERHGRVLVLFGLRPDLVGWAATVSGRPGEALLASVRHLSSGGRRPSRRQSERPRSR